MLLRALRGPVLAVTSLLAIRTVAAVMSHVTAASPAPMKVRCRGGGMRQGKPNESVWTACGCRAPQLLNQDEAQRLDESLMKRPGFSIDQVRVFLLGGGGNGSGWAVVRFVIGVVTLC